jgi:pimeloyl-ACP methyl ester carboxylesterase
MAERRLPANGIEFHCLEEGGEGPLALLLHGFPDTAHTWRHLAPSLARKGYHVVAPFQRGYAPTTVPHKPVFQTAALALDACALHEALGGDSDAVLVGHDWGALAAYGAAALEPQRWRRVVAMSVPHPSALAPAFFRYEQLRRSWYMFFFQMPGAEVAASLDHFRFLYKLWDDWSPGYDASWDLARVKESIGSPENLSAAIGYYRAQFDPSMQDPALAADQAKCGAPTPQPVLYLHGGRDGCIGPEAAANILEHLGKGSEQFVIDDAGHFLHLEQPETVEDLVTAFLSR